MEVQKRQIQTCMYKPNPTLCLKRAADLEHMIAIVSQTTVVFLTSLDSPVTAGNIFHCFVLHVTNLDIFMARSLLSKLPIGVNDCH